METVNASMLLQFESSRSVRADVKCPAAEGQGVRGRSIPRSTCRGSGPAFTIDDASLRSPTDVDRRSFPH